MSNLDIGGNGGGRSQGGVALGSPIDFQPSERERQFREWLLHDVLGTNEYKEHASWIGDQLVIGGFELPISQVLGFTQFSARAATPVATQETTTSTTYVNLTTDGPTLTGLSDGQYVVWFGAAGVNSGAGGSWASLSSNGSTPVDADGALMSGTDNAGLTRALVVTLSNGGNNTIKVQYRAGSGTAFFQSRWLVALRIANP